MSPTRSNTATAPRWRRRALIIIGLLVVAVAVSVAVGGPARLWLAVQSEVYGNVPALRGCADSPLKTDVEAELAKENPFLVRDDIYDAGAWALEACPDRAHIRIDFAGVDARRQLEDHLTRTGTWDPTAGWTWHGIPVSLINV